MLTIENHEHTIEVTCRGQRLVRYRVQPPASMPHFDLVALPPGSGARAGQNIVLAAPHDQAHHLGLFFDQPFIDGCPFGRSDLETGRGEAHGECRHIGGLACSVRDDGSVAFQHDVDWRTNAGEQQISEHRQIIVHPPESVVYRVEWVLRWEAIGSDRTLTSGSEPEDRSGLCYRCLRSMNRGALLTSEGAEGCESANGRRARWADYSGKLDGSLRPQEPDWAGITLFDHPDNHDHPVTWCCINEPFGFLAACRTFGKSWVLRRGETVTMRWAALVHAGPADRETIEDEYRRFSGQSALS